MKKAIIVGATSGIGKCLAKQLADDNYIVGITGRRVKLLEEIKNKNSSSYIIKNFDITNTAIVTKKLEELASEVGGVDLLISCSGTGDINNDLDFDTERLTIDTNITGFTCIVDWAYNYFENQRSGHLAAISSVGGLRGSREAPAYNASKAYQINYLEGLRQKATHTQSSVTVTDIRPGLVDTDMAKGEGLFWIMPVEKVTKQIMKGIRKKRKIVYVTKRWSVIALLLRILPKCVYDRM